MKLQLSNLLLSLLPTLLPSFLPSFQPWFLPASFHTALVTSSFLPSFLSTRVIFFLILVFFLMLFFLDADALHCSYCSRNKLNKCGTPNNKPLSGMIYVLALAHYKSSRCLCTTDPTCNTVQQLLRKARRNQQPLHWT